MNKSKGWILGCAMVLSLGSWTMRAQTSAPVKDDLFAGTEVFAKGASDVTEITMDPDTLGMVSGKDQARAHSMVLNVVRTYSYDKPGMYRIEDVEVFRNKLNSGDWHCSVHTRSLKSGESTDVCNKRRSDDMVESAIITVEPKSLTFIHTIRKRSPGESELGEMPMLMGLHGLPSLAMLDPGSMAEMAILKAQMGTMGVGSIGFGNSLAPGTLMLDIPDSDLKNLTDPKNLKELRDQVENMQKDKKKFLLMVPDDRNKPQPQSKPSPQ